VYSLCIGEKLMVDWLKACLLFEAEADIFLQHGRFLSDTEIIPMYV